MARMGRTGIRRGRVAVGLGSALAAGLPLLCLSGAITAASAAPSAAAAEQPHAAQIAVSLPAVPSYNGDAGDPDVVESNGTYYAFTTGTPLGNYIQVLVDTSGSPTSGWGSTTGQTYGSTALPDPPGWEQTNSQTSPGVFSYDGHWVMFYDAAQSGHPGDTGFDCLSVATAGAISPSSASFSDTSSGPLICQATLGGAIDPSPYVDPATGLAWLVWKSNDGGSSQPARIWTEQLNSSGTGFAPGTSPTQIFTNNTSEFAWEATVEDPSMLVVNGVYYLLFSGGVYTSSTYAEGFAVCTSPTATCVQTAANPIVSSYGSAAGPGGGSWFEDASGQYWLDFGAWAPGCTNYACGGARRLFVAPITITGSPTAGSGLSQPAVSVALAPGGQGYWIAARDGGIFNYGTAGFHGSSGGIHLNAPVVGMAPTADGGGYWEVASDGGIFNYGDAGFYGSTGALRLNKPIVGMAATSDGKGYWLVASDGGIFNYGDAGFYGSTGALRLNKPIVGMAATSDGKGYWLVASDGGIFNYGDAGFLGSTGNLHLNKPIVGMAASPDGGGYWMVASDGGIFNYGDAGFLGSTGALSLQAPIVGMAATSDGQGYLLVGADGGIFNFGDAPYLGSPA
jgi:hypothetical protein